MSVRYWSSCRRKYCFIFAPVMSWRMDDAPTTAPFSSRDRRDRDQDLEHCADPGSHQHLVAADALAAYNPVKNHQKFTAGSSRHPPARKSHTTGNKEKNWFR